MSNHFAGGWMAAALLLLTAPAAAAQDTLPVAIEAQAGYAGFLDDATIDHALAGAGVKVRLTRRLRLGPEIVWMRGPGDDRDLFLTGTLTWDILAPRAGSPVVPYLIAGGGLMRHSDRFGPRTFSSNEGALTGGAGARIPLARRWYVAPEFRIGWEPHYRVGASVGMDLAED